MRLLTFSWDPDWSDFYCCHPFFEAGVTPAQQEEETLENEEFIAQKIFPYKQEGHGETAIIWVFVGFFFNGKHLIYQHHIGLPIGILNNYCQGNVEKENQFLVLLKLNLKVKLNLSTAALVLFSVPQWAANRFLFL